MEREARPMGQRQALQARREQREQQEQGEQERENLDKDQGESGESPPRIEAASVNDSVKPCSGATRPRRRFQLGAFHSRVPFWLIFQRKSRGNSRVSSLTFPASWGEAFAKPSRSRKSSTPSTSESTNTTQKRRAVGRTRRAEAREERGRMRERGARSKEAKREQRGARRNNEEQFGAPRDEFFC